MASAVRRVDRRVQGFGFKCKGCALLFLVGVV